MTANDIARFLRRALEAERYVDDPCGVWRGDGEAGVGRLVVGLEPSPGVLARVDAGAADVVFLHRPWTLADDACPGTPVLTAHLCFDEHLTTGYNPWLAAALGLRDVRPLGEKDGRPLGMIGDGEARPFAAWADVLGSVFGGLEDTVPGPPGGTVVVMGAMTDALVRESAEAGTTCYVTGQLRKPAAAAVADTGIGVIAVGHRRSEVWGLHALAALLRLRFHGLDVTVVE